MVSTATRSPTSTPQRRAARSPIASIVPSGSCPGITGSGVRSTPSYCSWSLPQMPHASTRSSAVSASISGSGSSRGSSRRGAVCTMASVFRVDMRDHCPNLDLRQRSEPARPRTSLAAIGAYPIDVRVFVLYKSAARRQAPPRPAAWAATARAEDPSVSTSPLDAEQRRFYDENGYLVDPGLLRAQGARALDRAFHRDLRGKGAPGGGDARDARRDGREGRRHAELEARGDRQDPGFPQRPGPVRRLREASEAARLGRRGSSAPTSSQFTTC